MYVRVLVCAHEYSIHGNQKMALEVLEVELEAVLSHPTWYWELKHYKINMYSSLLNPLSSTYLLFVNWNS